MTYLANLAFTLNNTTSEKVTDVLGGSEYEPYYNLWCEVIRSGIRYNDVTYFLSDAFIYHCNIINISPDAIIYNMTSELQDKIKQKKRE